MRHELGWEAWERYVNKALCLDSTIASGSKAYDVGDGVDRRHRRETDYALMVDCKYTEQKSFSLNGKLMDQYVHRAAEAGKSFILPVRLVVKGGMDVKDFVVVPFEDYRMLLETYREAEGA